MWELDHKEVWAPKNWCFLIVGLEKTLESSLDCKEIKPVGPKGNQPWILIGRTDAEAEAPILGHLMQRADSLERTLILGKTEAGEEGNRGSDGWTTSLIQWTRTWTNSRRWWGTEEPDRLQSMGSKRVGHDQETSLSLSNSILLSFFREELC